MLFPTSPLLFSSAVITFPFFLFHFHPREAGCCPWESLASLLSRLGGSGHGWLLFNPLKSSPVGFLGREGGGLGREKGGKRERERERRGMGQIVSVGDEIRWKGIESWKRHSQSASSSPFFLITWRTRQRCVYIVNTRCSSRKERGAAGERGITSCSPTLEILVKMLTLR